MDEWNNNRKIRRLKGIGRREGKSRQVSIPYIRKTVWKFMNCLAINFLEIFIYLLYKWWIYVVIKMKRHVRQKPVIFNIKASVPYSINLYFVHSRAAYFYVSYRIYYDTKHIKFNFYINDKRLKEGHRCFQQF